MPKSDTSFRTIIEGWPVHVRSVEVIEGKSGAHVALDWVLDVDDKKFPDIGKMTGKEINDVKGHVGDLLTKAVMKDLADESGNSIAIREISKQLKDL